jgi:hypothetical protein
MEPFGLRVFWFCALSLLGHRSMADMLPRRYSHKTKIPLSGGVLDFLTGWMPACKAGASLFCHVPPSKMASRLRAARSKVNFGDSPALLVRGLAGKPIRKLERLPGMGFPSLASQVPNRVVRYRETQCTRTFSLARRHSAVKSQPRWRFGPAAEKNGQIGRSKTHGN